MANLTQTKSNRRMSYDQDGFWIERGLFSREEMESLCREFMDLHSKGGVPGRYEPQKETSYSNSLKNENPLLKYPRVMHPHRFMKIALDYLLEPRIMDILEELLGEPALTAQTMFYFKPAGSPGQAWHQDDFYLLTKPNPCIAAWIAVDKCDEENGCLQVVPNTNDLEVLCPDFNADPEKSSSKEIIPLARIAKKKNSTGEVSVVKALMEPGDVLFFNGNVVHGSTNNVSKDGFRRSLINHYIPSSSGEVSEFYHPLMNRKGEVVTRAVPIAGGGPCGTEQNDRTLAIH